MTPATQILLFGKPFRIADYFRMGQIGWHWQIDDPNTLYRRRNRLTYTRDFSNAAWVKPGATATATRITATASSGFHYVYQDQTIGTTGDPQTYTVEAKYVSIQWVLINFPNDSSLTFFDLQNGVFGSIGGQVTSYSAELLSDGYYRLILKAPVAVSFPRAGIGLAFNSSLGSFSAAGTEAVDVRNFQNELGSSATAYQDVPTTWPQAYLNAVGADRIYAWTDTAGTIPNTAIGEGIGLLLGREYGGATGPSLLANGTTGLTGTATAASYSTSTFAGSVSRAGDASNQSWVTWTGLTTSAVYRIRITNTGATSLDVRNGGVAGTIVASIAAGTSSWVHPATTGGSTSITITATSNSTTATFTLGQFAVLPGNHLTQATGTAKPTLSARVNLLLNTATLSTQNVTTLAAGYRLRFEGTGTVTLSGTVTAGPLSAGTHNVTATAGTLTLTVSGSVTQADLRTADDAAKNIPAYQRVGATATDHDTDGFPHAQTADGTDDSGTTATGGGNTTGFFYCGALTVSGGAGAARTIWSDTGTNTGYRVRINASNKLELAAGNGSAYTTVQSNETITAPGTYLLSAWDDGGVLAVQVNNFAPATTTRPSVSAGTSTITVYKDNGAASSYFNGRDYGSVYAQRYIGESAHNRLKRYLANVARITV